MKITRMSLAVAAAVTGLVVMAGPAQADPPKAGSFTQDLAGTDTADAGGFCAFPVHIDFVSNQKIKETTNPDDSFSQHFTGYASATVTNTATPTGKSLTYSDRPKCELRRGV